MLMMSGLGLKINRFIKLSSNLSAKDIKTTCKGIFTGGYDSSNDYITPYR